MQVELQVDDEAYEVPATAYLRRFSERAVSALIKHGLLPEPPGPLTSKGRDLVEDLCVSLLITIEDQGGFDASGKHYFTSLVFHERLRNPDVVLTGPARTALHGRLDLDIIDDAYGGGRLVCRQYRRGREGVPQDSSSVDGSRTENCRNHRSRHQPSACRSSGLLLPHLKVRGPTPRQCCRPIRA